MNIPEEVKQRIEQEAKNKFPVMVDEPGVINVERRNGYIEGATAEYLRGQDEIDKICESTNKTIMHWINETSKISIELQKQSDLLSEMATWLRKAEYPMAHFFSADEMNEISSLLQKHSKSKEA